VVPEGTLEVISQVEAAALRKTGHGGLYGIFRRCALAVLNAGSHVDDPTVIFDQYKDFEIAVHVRDRGIKLQIVNAPESAFVDGVMLTGVRELLFAVLRDIVYVHNEIEVSSRFDLQTTAGITNAVFHILRNARILRPQRDPNLVVCWGGHSISREEYDYSKTVGYELGLRGLNICTGCGPGAMKGPMKGATVAHAKQRIHDARYVGVTEPQIIAAESPNAIVNDLVIMPDIEKRLEAFVRAGHAVVVLPGGVGTMEEILYLLGILLHPKNRDMPFPLIFTGPESSREYFTRIDEFLKHMLGDEISAFYQIIVNEPAAVARRVKEGTAAVRAYRKKHRDAFYYNWRLQVDQVFQHPFVPTHENMAGLNLANNQAPHVFAANLRRAFSGIVAGNVKEEGITAIQAHGPFRIRGGERFSAQLDKLLQSFIADQRMRLPGTDYQPCYEVHS
jgi:predicted Rossmann-fold nucleotide-binding protein